MKDADKTAAAADADKAAAGESSLWLSAFLIAPNRECCPERGNVSAS